MDSLRTLSGALENAAKIRPNSGYTFVNEDGTEEEFTFTRLYARARAIASALAERGIKKGDPVALILPVANEFIPTFFGVVQAGAVPVPLYPPMGMGQLGGYLDHCKHIISASQAKLIVTTNQIKAVIGTVHEAAPSLRGMVTYSDLEGDEKLYRDPGLTLNDMAFIQFTSGSTSRPKGVVLSYESLAINCHAIMVQGLDYNSEDRGVSWLPLFHDMGLIGFVLAPVYHPTPVSFIPTLSFLKRPSIWLNTLSKHRGTITYAPNFAYAISVKRIREEEIPGIDLSSVRVAGCGAEPIQPDTLRTFVKRYAAQGFRESAIVPSYGMAENSLAIAFSRGITTERVKSTSLWEEGRAVLSNVDDPSSIEIVGCGKPFEGHALKIVHTETRADLPERSVGEIMIKGPSLMQGYFNDEEKTRETIDPDGWLRTGDVGYVADGSVYICGRQKDVIIINGKNYYPQDLEWVASNVDGVRTGNVAAFATHKQGLDREAVVLIAESKVTPAPEGLGTEIRSAIQRAIGLVVDEVIVAESGTVPKTSSGKIQRSKARQLYEQGELKKKEAEGAVGIAKRVIESQFSHLKLSIFGGKK